MCDTAAPIAVKFHWIRGVQSHCSMYIMGKDTCTVVNRKKIFFSLYQALSTLTQFLCGHIAIVSPTKFSLPSMSFM
jgi:hypothetical protein